MTKELKKTIRFYKVAEKVFHIMNKRLDKQKALLPQQRRNAKSFFYQAEYHCKGMIKSLTGEFTPEKEEN